MEDNKKDRLKIANNLSRLKLDNATMLQLFENSSDYVLISNKHNQFVWTSKSFNLDFGWSPEELQTKSFDDLIHPADIYRVSQQHTKDITGDRTVLDSNLLSFRLLTKSNEYKLIELNLKHQTPIKDHLIAIARPKGTEAEKSFKEDAIPASVETFFKDNKPVVTMSSSADWWTIFKGMELRDIAISAVDSIAWQCYLKDGAKFKDVQIMDWHMHEKQNEELIVIDGSLKLRIELKRWWYKFFGINRNKITHFKTVNLKATESYIIKKGLWHDLIGTGTNTNYLVFWTPKLRHNEKK